MGLGKWIGSAMGFMTMGPLGALAGYFIGSWFDKQAVGMQEDLQADEAGRANYEQGQRNSFLFSMLVMASYVIRADRKNGSFFFPRPRRHTVPTVAIGEI